MNNLDRLNDADFHIIGASTAGAILAEKLTAYGKVVMIDKAIPGTYNNCGGGLPEKLFKELNLDIPFVKINKMIFSRGEQKSIVPCEYVVINRSEFNKALFDKAIKSGATFIKGNLISYDKNSSEIECSIRDNCGSRNQTKTIKYKKLILAQGIVKTKSKLAIQKKDFHSIANLEIIKEESPYKNQLYIDLSSGFNTGYSWIFPMPNNQTNIGCGCLDTGEFSTSLLKSFKKKHNIDGEVLSKGGGLIPASPLLYVRDVNIFRFGDSAGMVNPLNGEGLKHIIKGADLWVNAIVHNRSLNYNIKHIARFAKHSIAKYILKLVIYLDNKLKFPLYSKLGYFSTLLISKTGWKFK